MLRLAVLPNDPIDLYLSSGYSAEWLRAYFNPTGLFEEVYSVTPYERVDGSLVGLKPVPTPPFQLRSRLRELRIDVVRAYGGTHACPIACRDKLSGIPVVVSVHDTLPAHLDRSIAEADVVLCVSDAVKRLVAPFIRTHDRVWTLPNRVDFGVMRPHTPEETADLDSRYPFRYRIFHVGRKTRQKNLDTLVRALGPLGPDYCLIAVGKGSTDSYARLAEEAGVRGRCFFVDAMAHDELPRYYSWADCVCHPARWEGQGIVIIEALAAGAILVASDIPVIRESVVSGESGVLLADFENPCELAAAIRAACTDKALRERLRANARPSVARFERSRIDALEANYYRQVLDLKRQGAFLQPLTTRVRRSVRRTAREWLPQSVKHALGPLVGRSTQASH